MRYIITMLLLSTTASAQDNPDFKQFFLVNGKQVNAETAILASLKGSESFKCTAMQAKVSKSGASIGLKQIKKKLD
jgi:hypothetical protein